MRSRKGLAVASGGGHWQQLMLLSPAFAGCDIIYVSTNLKFIDPERCPNFRIFSDANRNTPFGAFKCLVQSAAIVWKERPDFIVSTGALPGLICLVVGRLAGARTVWIDSLANSEKPSMCGKIARHISNRWFTQWEHLGKPNKSEFAGALL